MEFREAKIEDSSDIMEIIEQAQAFLKEQGVDQWQDGYPDSAVIEEDIRDHRMYVLEEENERIACVALSYEREESYRNLYDGHWLSEEEDYAVIHRIAVKSSKRRKGIGRILFDLCEKKVREAGVKSLRIDTHEDNSRMRNLCKKNGFSRCGIIYLAENGEKRTAYEKCFT